MDMDNKLIIYQDELWRIIKNYMLGQEYWKRKMKISTNFIERLFFTRYDWYSSVTHHLKKVKTTYYLTDKNKTRKLTVTENV